METIDNIMEICDKLKGTNSRIEKESILLENSDNFKFKEFLCFLLNPFIITGISAKKINKIVNHTYTREFYDLFDLFRYVKVNNTGTDEVIANIQFFINQNIKYANFIEGIITKTLRLGCDVKTVNKVYGKDFIPQWEVQQSFSYEKYELNENEWFSLSEKLNGVRGTYYQGEIISRQGKAINGLNHIIEEIANLGEGEFVYDGELRRINIDNVSDNENFRIGTGIINAEDADKASICFTIFDIIPLDEFNESLSSYTYKTRMLSLVELGNKIESLNLRYIDIVPILYSGDDYNMIYKFLDEMIKTDKEGLILNRDVIYKRKRHNGILKIKQFYTIDVQIKSLEEGSGRLSGKLGAFVVDYKGNELRVGSGITDSQRDEYWQKRDDLIGRVIEIKYKEESIEKTNGKASLQFPIFIQIREKGKEVSYE